MFLTRKLFTLKILKKVIKIKETKFLFTTMSFIFGSKFCHFLTAVSFLFNVTESSIVKLNDLRALKFL